MTVIACYEIASGREGQEFSNQRGGVSAREYTKRFFIQTNNSFDGEVEVSFAPGLPLMGDPYSTSSGEFDNGAVVTRRTYRQIDNTHKKWHADVFYSTDWERTDQPLFDPPIIDRGTETFQQDVIGEANQSFDPSDPFGEPFDKPMVNSAGDYIEGLTRDSSRRVITVTRNESSWDDAFAASLIDTINASTWNGYTQRTVLCRAIDVIGQWHKNVNNQPDYLYYQVKYTFVVKFDYWIAKPIDRGPRFFQSGERTTFTDKTGANYVGLLDGHGGRLLPESADQTTTLNATPKYLLKRIYRETNFDQFNINLLLPLANQKLRRT